MEEINIFDNNLCLKFLIVDQLNIYVAIIPDIVKEFVFFLK
jgi:hypothetical protein